MDFVSFFFCNGDCWVTFPCFFFFSYGDYLVVLDVREYGVLHLVHGDIIRDIIRDTIRDIIHDMICDRWVDVGTILP